MDVEAPRGLLRFFDEIQDPRMDRTNCICSVTCSSSRCATLFAAPTTEWRSSYSARQNSSGFELFLFCPTEFLRTTP